MLWYEEVIFHTSNTGAMNTQGFLHVNTSFKYYILFSMTGESDLQLNPGPCSSKEKCVTNNSLQKQ